MSAAWSTVFRPVGSGNAPLCGIEKGGAIYSVKESTLRSGGVMIYWPHSGYPVKETWWRRMVELLPPARD
jgi:hypothetical protein